ncbi:MAG: hypothetical protein K6G92_11430, partial [Bacteroidaceae bacterium]|nr:hypothetical protein [Bacteroidaceae bacterium]
MKQKLFKTMLLLCALVAGSTSVWGDTTKNVTLSGGTFSTDHIEWTLDDIITIQQTKGTSSTAVNSSYISAPRVYKGHVLSFVAETGYAIKSISITYNGSYKGNSMTAGIAMSGNTVTDNTTAVDRTWASSTGGTHVASSASDEGLSTIYIQNVATETNTQLRPTAISITYTSTGSSSAVATTTTIDASGITNTDVNTSTAAGSLSATVTVTAGGAAVPSANVTWTSSDTGVATVGETTGVVTLVAAGTTTITATYAGVENEYQPSEKTYNLTVTSSAPDYVTLPFNWAGGTSAALTALTGVTASGLGTDYAEGNAPYRVKFDGTG